MLPISESYFSSIINNAEAQHKINTALYDKLIGCLEDISKLNLDAAKAILAESVTNAKEILWESDPQEFFSLAAAHIIRSTQSIVFYGSEATRLASETQFEFNKALGTKISEASRNGAVLMAEFTKNVGAEHLVKILKFA